MTSPSRLRPRTSAIHSGKGEAVGEPLGLTIEATTSFILPESGDGGRCNDYARVGTEQMRRLEAQVSAIEGSADAVTFASGISAFTALLGSLAAGDLVVAEVASYGCTIRLLDQFSRWGLRVIYADLTSEEGIRAIEDNKPKVVMVESPTNPTLKVLDIRKIADAAHSVGALLSVDNTFATGVLQQPLKLGADVVVVSLSKYHNGHSSALIGAVCTNNSELIDSLLFQRKCLGLHPGSLECSLTTQGIQTLAIRMAEVSRSGLAVADFLHQHSRVGRVYYPLHPSHPNYELATRQMLGGSGVVAAELGPRAEGFVAALRPLFSLSHGVGSTKSQVSIPVKQSHADVKPSHLKQAGVSPSLVRLSIGLEDVDDLIDVLEKALS